MLDGYLFHMDRVWYEKWHKMVKALDSLSRGPGFNSGGGCIFPSPLNMYKKKK